MSQNKGNGKAFKSRMIELSKEYKTLQDFADALGVTRQTLGHWLNPNSDRTPNLDMLVELSKNLGVSIDYLVGLTDNNSLDADIQAVTNATGLSAKAVETIMNLGDSTELFNRILEENMFLTYFNYYVKAYSISDHLIKAKSNVFGDPITTNDDGVVLSYADSRRFFIMQASSRFDRMVTDLCDRRCSELHNKDKIK